MGQQTMHSPSPSPSQRRPERNTSCGMCLHIRIHSLPLVSHLFPQALSPSVLYTFYCLLAAVGRSFPQVISPSVFVHVLLSASSCGTFLPTGPLSRFCTRFIACWQLWDVPSHRSSLLLFLYTFYCLLAAVGCSCPQVLSPSVFVHVLLPASGSCPQVLSPSVFVHVLLPASSCVMFLPTGPLSFCFCTCFIACYQLWDVPAHRSSLLLFCTRFIAC